VITLDSTTRAAYLAESTLADRAQAVLDALTDPVTITVYDGVTEMGSGTMAAPWATRSSNVLTTGEVTSFAVTSSGTPGPGWTLRFESGSAWIRGTFGFEGADFSWSLPTWASGQSGRIGTIVINATNEGLVTGSGAITLGEVTVSGTVTVDDGVAGDFVDGESYVITGSGFGTKTTAAPILWDNITNSDYGTITDGATVPDGSGEVWEVNYNDRVKFSTGTTRANSKPTYTATSSGATLENETRSKTKTGKVYVSWWFRPSTSIPGGEHSSKFLRMSDSRSLTNMTFSWTQQQSIIYDAVNANVSDGGYDDYAAVSWHGSGMTGAAWNFCEVWFDTANHNYVIKVNNSTVTDYDWDADSDFDPNIFWLIGWDGGGVSPPSLTWNIDCIYWDNSFARVLLGNASTYAACTGFEMQPVTSWSSTSITVTANKGARTGTAYLYVIDSDGTLVNSSGHEVTVE
jgi:hypothetical protein